MHVALAGCRAVGTWAIGGEGDRPWERDDRPLVAALEARGAEVSRPAWDDPAVDWARFDVVLPRATWDYHHHQPAFVAWAERVGRAARLINPAPVLAWNSVKTYLRELPVPQPETVWLTDADRLEDEVRARGWSRAFLKPVVGATAEGTLRFAADEEGLAGAVAHARAWLLRGELLLQPYLPSVETLGERSAVAIGGEVTHWVRKLPVPGDYRVQDDYGATDEPHLPSPPEVELVRRALDHLRSMLPDGAPLAYARVDWIPDDRGAPLLVELELVEPCLFFRHGPHAAARLAELVTG